MFSRNPLRGELVAGVTFAVTSSNLRNKTWANIQKYQKTNAAMSPGQQKKSCRQIVSVDILELQSNESIHLLIN